MGDGDRTHVGAQLTTLMLCALYRRTIKLTCPNCRRERRFDAVALWWLFQRRGWSDRLPAAYRRLYCQTCFGTGKPKFVPWAEVNRDPPDAEQPPYPDEREWKRLVSRHRA